MKTHQQNQLAMYQAVLRFFEGDGAPLVAIKRIDAGRTALAGVVTRIEAAAAAQDHDTTGLTLDRNGLKVQAGQRAEVLRLLVVALTDNAGLRGELKHPLSKMIRSKDAELLAYLRKIDGTVATLRPEDLADAGYEPQVRTGLQADIKALTDTKGAAREVTTSSSTATDTLEGLFAEATTVLEKQLDPLVTAQQLKHPELVTQYEANRRIVKTAARRKAEYRGVAQYGKPTLVYDRREAGLPQPTLGNRSGRGLTLRYYTAATSTAAPAPGQGVVVKHKTDQQLADYSGLGAEDAPYLLVVLEQVDGEGRWVVR
ncbi:hypothetical protein EJV47_20995 [Hymenobacter gummosus]|uniref:Uncharacterized protein n=1 Tax=Hymenobacter gummosus TaxID=1776032 RepID=A0A3S0JEJ4_9BACT|nr:hypothetical protein [Hymenobacter gummosus]RTQ46850.1 hypothetical protein EJV47_20995 [Hymenobacter gummosus]